VLICCALAAAVLAVYSSSAGNGFINFDDDLYVYENPIVRSGFSLEGLRWAFSSVTLYYWQPLTWISHMLDCQLFGLDPGPPHVVNMLLHAANAILFFLLLCRLARRVWPAAFAAALFALHPLRVESVAWVAERKDVLCALFFLLTLWAYVLYVERPSRRRYAGVCVAFLLALMAKPTAVTLPFLLLLLDYWPLGRLRLGRPVLVERIREKLPLLAMSAAISAVTYFGQQEMHAISQQPLGFRVANALCAYARYLGLTFFPHDLALLYPYPKQINGGNVLLSFLLLAAISAAVWILAARKPYLPVGWLWFTGALIPNIGLVQAGSQALADRFTYIPSLGLSVLLVWGLWDIASRWKRQRSVLAGAAAVSLPLLAWQSAQQVHVWKDGVTAFSRAAALTPEDALIQHDLGYALTLAGQPAAAIPHYREALRLQPNNFRAHYNLGRALAETGADAEAVPHLERALQLHPGPQHTADAENALAIVLARQGRGAEAEPHFREALKLRPNSPELHNNLGSLLARRRLLDAAIAEFTAAVRLNPSYAEAHRNLAYALLEQGKRTEALAEFTRTLELSPGDTQARRQAGLLQQKQ
jgi:Flp pilus assembly protein TadD